LSPAQQAHFAEKSYFEVVVGDAGKQYRIYAGAGMNVCEVGEKGRPILGLCFRRGTAPRPFLMRGGSVI
jgi:hypothetical protein